MKKKWEDQLPIIYQNLLSNNTKDANSSQESESFLGLKFFYSLMGVLLENCSKSFLSSNLDKKYMDDIYEISSNLFDIYLSGLKSNFSSQNVKNSNLDCVNTCLNFLQLITEEEQTAMLAINNSRFMKLLNLLSETAVDKSIKI